MQAIHIITPVKDSVELTLETIKAIMTSSMTVPFEYTVYNDFSTPETTALLQEASRTYGFTLVNLEDVTSHPSPNYLMILQMAQKKALEAGAGMLIVESDVLVKPDTLQKLYDGAVERPDCGMAAAITADDMGRVNYPYLFARHEGKRIYATARHLSFCCTLLTENFLKSFNFGQLNPNKNWHDVTISYQSRRHGYKNYLFSNLQVWHRPHGSRPWKHLKYSNPLKYYWLKFTQGRDKI
ncbi:MAG: glycosyltransferase [Bacteroidales bacterium]